MSKLVFDAIGKYIHPMPLPKSMKRRASMSSLARSRGFRRKTKNTALLLLKFTMKIDDAEKLLLRVTSASKNFKVPRVQKWTGAFSQDSDIQLPTLNLQLRECKKYQPLPQKGRHA